MGFTRKNIHENTIFNIRFTNSTALCILKNQLVCVFISFVFIFCRGELIQINLSLN